MAHFQGGGLKSEPVGSVGIVGEPGQLPSLGSALYSKRRGSISASVRSFIKERKKTLGNIYSLVNEVPNVVPPAAITFMGNQPHSPRALLVGHRAHES